jgi:hypothetical protein
MAGSPITISGYKSLQKVNIWIDVHNYDDYEALLISSEILTFEPDLAAKVTVSLPIPESHTFKKLGDENGLQIITRGKSKVLPTVNSVHGSIESN